MDKGSRMELLKLYQDEWKFRHDGFWKRITQFFVIDFFASTLPITIRIFNTTIPKIPLLIFPAVGFLLALLLLWYSLAEGYRINANNDRINALLMCFPSEYQRTGKLKRFFNKKKEPLKIFYWPIAFCVPIVLFILEFAIVILMLVLILTGHLSTY